MDLAPRRELPAREYTLDKSNMARTMSANFSTALSAEPARAAHEGAIQLPPTSIAELDVEASRRSRALVRAELLGLLRYHAVRR